MLPETPSRPDPLPHDTRVNCPRCAAPMERLHLHEGLPHPVHVDRCAHCRGIWLDQGEREIVAAHPRLARRVDPTSPLEARSGTRHPLRCPRDGSTLIQMSDVNQPHVHFESCTVCGGSFLDPGELADLSHLNILERVRSWLP